MSNPILLWISTGIRESVDFGTTLDDICRTFPSAYLIEKNNKNENNEKTLRITHRTRSFILQKGIIYEVHMIENNNNNNIDNNLIIQLQNEIKELKSRIIKLEEKQTFSNIKQKSKRRPLSKSNTLDDDILPNKQEILSLKIPKSPSSPKTKRQQIINEIITGEQIYHENLKILMELYYPEFLKIQDSDLLTPSDVKCIFNGIQIIITTSHTLINDLKEEITNNPDSPNIGQVFMKNIVIFKSYTSFVSDYSDRITLLKTLKSNSKYNIFIKELEDKHQDKLQKRTLNDILIHPVKRIPQYLLLLSTLIKNTSKDHPDYNNLCSAEENCRNIAEHFEEQSQNLATAKKVLQVMNTLRVPKKFSKFKVSTPHRCFLFEDYLKVNLYGKTNHFISYCFNDCVLFSIKGSVRSLWGNNDYTLKGFFKFIKVQSIKSLQSEGCIIVYVFHKHGIREIKLYPSSDKYSSWLTYLNEKNELYTKQKKESKNHKIPQQFRRAKSQTKLTSKDEITDDIRVWINTQQNSDKTIITTPPSIRKSSSHNSISDFDSIE